MRISETARRGVVFLGVKNATGAVHFGGTGFLVHYAEQGVNVCYLITCRHVAEKLAANFVVRANLKAGGSAELQVEETYWAMPEDPSVDLAATIFALPGQQFEHGYFRLNDGLAPESEITCGNPVNIIGLFRLHKGAARNIPIVHSGHIAALPDPHERIPAKNSSGQQIEVSAYLIEAQTLDGLSGAPVWVTRFANVPSVKTSFSHPPIIIAGASLLGVYQASWEGVASDLLSAERNLALGTRVPVGMGLVVPAPEIVKLIQSHPGLAERKAEYIKESLRLGVSLATKK